MTTIERVFKKINKLKDKLPPKELERALGIKK
mgnify:CR=1 FL=1